MVPAGGMRDDGKQAGMGGRTRAAVANGRLLWRKGQPAGEMADGRWPGNPGVKISWRERHAQLGFGWRCVQQVVRKRESQKGTYRRQCGFGVIGGRRTN